MKTLLSTAIAACVVAMGISVAPTVADARPHCRIVKVCKTHHGKTRCRITRICHHGHGHHHHHH